MVQGDFEYGKSEYVSFKVMQGQGQGQTTRSFWPKNNPYYEVLVLENS